jgi:hypothetical protein
MINSSNKFVRFPVGVNAKDVGKRTMNNGRRSSQSGASGGYTGNQWQELRLCAFSVRLALTWVKASRERVYGF